jgi:translation initiation factor IF-3
MSSFIFPKFLGVIGINKQKKDEAIVNEAIRAKEMLVITDTGEKLGVISRAKALNEAYDRGMDLVLVSPDANPLVAKMMDYSRLRFEQQKKLKEMKKNQKVTVVQEIQLSPTIEKHDFETMANKAKTILAKGNKVKITLRFYGRMIVHQELGTEVIDRFIESLQEVANIEAQPKMDGRIMFAVLVPKSENDKEKEKKNIQ